MKGSFFNRPIEWSLETHKESWTQGESIQGVLKLKNHGPELVALSPCGVSLAVAEIKKVHSRDQAALKIEQKQAFSETKIDPNSELNLEFNFPLPANCIITDKKISYFLTYGPTQGENHLMLQVGPRPLYSKVISLFDTFHRFKLKEMKSTKKGVEYKILPPNSRELSHLESLSLTLSMEEETLNLNYEFQVKKLDTTSVTTKLNKEVVKIHQALIPKEYSLGREMLNQDGILKYIEAALGQIKLKVF